MADVLERSIKTEMINHWYPRVVDTLYGGFLSNYKFDWQPADNQDKMIVTQARHTWSNARAMMLYKDNSVYPNAAQHGLLRQHLPGWRGTATIRFIKDISNTLKEAENRS